MSEKVLLILVDGMRPDSLEVCGHPFIKRLIENASYTAEARTVMPSVTLPCHMSLFHSVTPDRHGILTNTYMPQVRPINGLFEQLRQSNKSCGFFYNWGELRDLAKPDSIACGCYVSGHIYTYKAANQKITDEAIKYINKSNPDFTFLYLGYTDAIGHDYGWMTEEYIKAVYESWDCIERIVKSIPDDYAIIITADHGGHGRSHGSEIPEDMTIPLFLKGKAFNPNSQPKDANIIDIAPTVTKLLGVQAADEWEGKPLI
ncbi:MAG: sulfatase-like hydrolase/transferase [Clostridiales bacterium]|jgi:predicted AlkP superfamily pyrophosphatase or phosphodiesterase|nr:sulfatase-like hydrolase/transferase [Clostridiales bacterium]